MAERDWVPELKALAARRAQLLGVRGQFYDHRRSSDEERDWPLGWLRAISSSDDFTNQDWPWGLWFAFAYARVLYLEGLGSGEGFRLELVENLPETTAPRPERTYIEDLSDCRLSQPSSGLPCGRSSSSPTRPDRRARWAGTTVRRPIRPLASG